MSLAVAQTTEDGPRIVSDSRVGFPNERRSSFKTGALKTVIVGPTVAVCFAGEKHIGLEGIRRFATGWNDNANPNTLLNELFALATRRGASADFLVAMAEADSDLVRVTAGGIERNLHTAWIGDKNGFERFQEVRNRPLDATDQTIMEGLPSSAITMTVLGRAMEAVIADPAIESVDDICIRVAAKDGKFNYLDSSFIYVGRNISIKDGDNLVTRMAQPVEEGGYAITIVSPLIPGTPALGLNFPRARLGMIYLPLAYDNAQVIEAVLPKDFSTEILKRYGVKMNDPMLR